MLIFNSLLYKKSPPQSCSLISPFLYKPQFWDFDVFLIQVLLPKIKTDY